MVTMVPAPVQDPLVAPLQSWAELGSAFHSGKERGLGVAGHGINGQEAGQGAVVTKPAHKRRDRNVRTDSEEGDMTRGQGR